jgi:Tfp pilus assembly PilM family ATPase
MHCFSSGIPAPQSLELSTLAVLTAFEHGPVANNASKTTGLIDFGTTETFLSIFHNKKLVLLRKFDFGTNIVMEGLKSTLHVTTEVAHGMIDDSSFDLSDMLDEHMSSIASEFILSRDFIEREDNCKINMLYAIGGIALSTTAMQNLEIFMNIDITPWNPFDGLKVPPQTFLNDVEGQRWRFAGAIGAALATLEKK